MKINTSMSIDEKVLNQARDRAEKDRRSLSEIIQFALEAYLR